jgi:phosphatidylethanolamine-binding protein (PEBP) family uncharacterized protein
MSERRFMKGLTISSPAFEANKLIPSKHTCDGEDVNPPLNIEGVPAKTESLVLIVDDPDPPMGHGTTGQCGTYPQQTR